LPGAAQASRLRSAGQSYGAQYISHDKAHT